MGNRYYYERGDTYDEDTDGAPLCPECEAYMAIIVNTADPLYQCPNCKLEQYESKVAEFWQGYVAEEEEAWQQHIRGGVL